MTDYEKIIDQISTKNYILLGDVNAHDRLWGPTQDTKGKNLTDLIFKYDLTILNDGNPTMTEHNTKPDITLATPNLGITSEWHTLDNSCGSDHLPIISQYQVRYNATGTAVPAKWILDKADWDLYKKLCSEQLKINEKDTTKSINEKFTKCLQDISDKTIPKSNPLKKKLKPPWWNEKCTQAIKSREKARKKYLKSKTTTTKETFNQAKAEARNTLIEVQKLAWQDFISKMTYKTNSKTVWNMVNRFRGKFFDSVTCLKINNTIITEDKEKADALAQHYDNMAKDSNLDPDFKIVKITKENEFNENLPNIRHDNENNLNKNLTMFELNQALNSKRNSSPGGDTIAYEMLKQLPNESKIELLKLINTSWE